MVLATSSESSSTAVASAPKRCLLVEDNPVFGAQIQQAMRALPSAWHVVWCRTGREALQAAEELSLRTPLHLALVDLGLPDLNGIEVVRALHRTSPSTPVMVASVVSAESSVLQAIRAGARGYVLKGESLAHVIRAIEQILQGEYPISPRLARMLFRIAGSPPDATEESRTLNLSPREAQALRLLAQGLSYKEVASSMGVTVSTVQTYIRILYRKLDAHSQVQAVNNAKDQGLI